MSKLNRIVVVIGFGLILPNVNYAEYSYGPGYSAAMTGAVKGLGSALKGKDGNQDVGDSVQANLDRVEQNLIENKELYKKIKRNADGRAREDKILKLETFVDIQKQNRYKDQEANNQRISQFVAGLSKSTPGVNAADVNVNNLENACKNGVDFSQFKALADQMASEPFHYLRDQVSQLLKEKDKAAQERRKKGIQEMLKHLDDKVDDDPSFVAQARQTKRSIIDDPNALKKLGQSLDRDWDARKKSIAERRKQLFKKLFGDLANAGTNKDDTKFAQALNGFADSAEAYRKASLDTARQNADTLKQNCEDEVDKLGRDNPLNPNGLMGAAYTWAVAVSGASYANAALYPGLAALSQSISRGCPDASSDLDNLFGNNLQTAINAVRGQKDPAQAMQNALGLLDSIANAQQQVGPTLQPLMDKCNSIAKQSKKAQQMVRGAQQQFAQAQQGAGQGQQAGAQPQPRNPGAGVRNAAARGGNRGGQAPRTH